MKTFEITRVELNPRYDGWNGNNSYNLTLKDLDTGQLFLSEGFMDMSERKPGQTLTLSSPQISLLRPL